MTYTLYHVAFLFLITYVISSCGSIEYHKHGVKYKNHDDLEYSF